MAFTGDQIIQLAQELSDEVNSDFVDATTWLNWLNVAQERLFQIVSNKFKDTFYKLTTFSLAAPTNSFTLPSDFRRLKLLTKDPTLSTRRTIRKFNLVDRNLYRAGSAPPWGRQDIRYRVVSLTTLLVEPPENCTGNFELAYTNGPTLLTLSSQTVMAELTPWFMWLALSMARSALIKDENTDAASMLTAQMQEIETEIAEAAETDETGADTIADVDADHGYGAYWPFGR